MLIVVLLPGTGMVIVTRTDALSGPVLSGIASSLGAEARASSVRLTWGGEIVVTDLEVTAPGVEASASRVLAVPQLVAEIDWGSTLSGTPRVTEVRVIRPVVRVSQHVETGALNLAALRGSSGTGSGFEIPRFTIVDGRIELAEHSDTWYSPLRDSTLRVDGLGGQVSGDPDLFEYRFTELDDAGTPDPTRTQIEGTIDLQNGTVFAELDAVDLSDWSRRTLPSAYQPMWENLELRGRVPGARFLYGPRAGLAWEVDVAGVTLKLPVNLREGSGRQLVELSGVSGTLGFSPEGFEADIVGNVEDLPLTITLAAERFTPDTALRLLVGIDDFRLSSENPLMPVLPEMAVRILDRFGQPSGVVNLSMAVSRGAPASEGVPAAWTYAGSAEVSDGRARFDEFPYPITDIDARFVFDEKGFEIDHLTGRGASGGTVEATGYIRPPGDGAEVRVDVAVRGVPLDDRFRDAMPESRRPIYDVLFDRGTYERLREAGLIAPAGEDSGGAHPFDLAGDADLDILVERPLGADTRYTTTIGVRIAEAGIVPVGFGYPVVGRDIELEITPRLATIESASLRGVTGMTGSITGSVAFPKGEDARPDLTITARAMPIDRALALALPAGGMGEAASPRDALLELGLTGELSGTAHVSRAEGDEDRIGFTVTASLDGVSSSPDQRLRLDGVTGTLEITRDDLSAQNLAGTIGGSGFRGGVDIVFARPLYGVEASIEGAFEAEDVELSAPFEDLASRFDDTAGAALGRLREKLAPAGRVDAALAFGLREDEELAYTLRLEPRSDMSLRLDGVRWDAHQARGVVTVTPGLATFEAFSAAVGVAGGERFSTLLDGTLPTGEGEGTLFVEADAVRLDSETARTLIADRFPKAGEALETLGVADAVFDLEATLEMAGGETGATWEVMPRAVDVLRSGVRTEADAVGLVRGEAGSVMVEGLVLTSPTWRLGVSGSRGASGAGTFGVDLRASAIDGALLSLVPPRVSDALTGMELALDEGGAFALEDATLTLSPGSPTLMRGGLAYEGLSGVIGVPITGARGSGRVAASEDAFELGLAMDELALANIRMTDATLRAVRHAPGENLLIPTLRGRVHDGLLIGRAVVRTSQQPVTYELSAELASARFAGVLDDLGAGGEGTSSDRGRMDAGLLLYGRLDRPAERRGRVTVRVQGGRVLDLPGIIPLLELANLQAPANERVDLGYMDLFIGGERAMIDRLTLFSDSLRIAGTGEVDLTSMGMDLSFSTYGARYVPILSTLIEGLREEIASTRVTGTLGAPEFRTEQLRSTRALLDAIAGPIPEATPPRADTSDPAEREPPGAPERPQ